MTEILFARQSQQITTVVNDTNVTGVISGNTLTLGWTGVITATRVGSSGVASANGVVWTPDGVNVLVSQQITLGSGSSSKGQVTLKDTAGTGQVSLTVGALSGQTSIMLLPNTGTTDTLAALAAAQTLSNKTFSDQVLCTGQGGVGYATGAGGAIAQGTSRTTGVTLNTVTGAITLFSAAGSATAATFTVTNSSVAALDTVVVSVKSGTNVYLAFVSAVAAGSFNITFQTTGGTSVDAPVINFAVIKAVAS